jgi:hypothetical protein
MKKYIFDNDSLDYIEYKDKLTNDQYAIIAMLISAFIFIGMYIGYKATDNYYNNMLKQSKTEFQHEMVYGGDRWCDSVFTEYKIKADLYINTNYENSPVTGEILSLAAYNAYDSTGILLPLELALAQCQWESGMGLKGRSPKNNPFNIGENDSGTVKWFNSTFDGVQAYYYYMTTNYLSCKTIEQLFNNFTNCNGYRYASGDYEKHVPPQYYYIKKWFKQHEKNIK